MTPTLAITGMGIVSPVGLTAEQTCAALRAGITRFRQWDGTMDRHGDPFTVAHLPDFDPAELPLERAKRAAVSAGREAIGGLPREDRIRRRWTVSLLVKEVERPGAALGTDGLIPAIAGELGLPASTTVRVDPDGNAGGMNALRTARDRLGRQPDALELILGLDSLLHPQTLRYLESADRLKSPTRPRGVIPGEACACLLLQTEESARARGARIQARVTGIGTAIEPAPDGSDQPCLGTGLTHAVAEALEMAGWRKHDVVRVHADLNGEEYRAHEWMLMQCRALAGPTVVHPADCIGDVGAASAPLLIAMAAVALEKGYAGTSGVLVCCSSDFGARGCACVSHS
jgi:3-oxoacyl-[acyl-carrier-protein] synthase-1